MKSTQVTRPTAPPSRAPARGWAGAGARLAGGARGGGAGGPRRGSARALSWLASGPPGSRTRLLQWALILITVMMGAAAVPVGLMVLHHQGQLAEFSRFDSIFSGSRIMTELLRFEMVATAQDLPDPRFTRDDLALWYEILVNRHAVLDHGKALTLLDGTGDHRAVLASVGDALRRAGPLIEDWQPGNGRRLLDIMLPLNPDITRLITDLNIAWIARSARTQDLLLLLHWILAGLLGGMVASSLGSAALLARHSRRALHAADHDALTGLPNRAVLRRRLDALAAARSCAEPDTGRGAFLLMLDLDRFKDVNDTLGHAAGDALLCGVAGRLRRCVPPAALVTRLGGDEFAVLLADTGPVEAERVAADIIAGVNRPYVLSGRDLLPGVSIGIAEFGRSADAAETMRNADLALYRAKAERRGSARVFHPDMAREQETRLMLLAGLPAALREEQFEVVFQPVVNLRDRRIVGMEALLRWRHPKHGLVMPGVFIPLAEESGLIDDIGLWVLRRACAEAVHWPAHVQLAVNLSARQLDRSDMADRIMAVLAEAGLPATRLELEITETALMRDGDAVKASLDAMRAAGMRIALDDFGTGYASLSYLRRFPFDRLKIDRSFVGDMLERPESRIIVRDLARMAAHLGMATTAEGLETEKLARLSEDLGCTEGQGYHFAHPLSATEARARLVTDLPPVSAEGGAG